MEVQNGLGNFVRKVPVVLTGLLLLVPASAVETSRAGMPIPRKEHPKPQFYRDTWMNLNGEWNFAFDFGVSGVEKGWPEDPAALDRGRHCGPDAAETPPRRCHREIYLRADSQCGLRGLWLLRGGDLLRHFHK